MLSFAVGATESGVMQLVGKDGRRMITTVSGESNAERKIDPEGRESMQMSILTFL